LFVANTSYFVVYFQIRAKLMEHFGGTCGEPTRVSIPKDFESGYSKGYVSLQNSTASPNAALKTLLAS